MTSGWVVLRTFSSRFEAEYAHALLSSAEIPSIMDTQATGLFGPGFQGAIPGGVALRVPEAALEDARELLSDIV